MAKKNNSAKAVFGQNETQNTNLNQTEKRMQKNNTKSAGVSHPAANMADLGKNIDKNTMATKFIPTIATIVTNTITPNTDIYNGKAWYNWEELNVTGYEGVLEVAHQLCDILHHHAKEIVEAEGVTNPDEVLFAPLLDKYVSLHGCAWFKPSCDEYYHEYRIHNRYDGVICYGGLHLSDWLTKPTGQRFSNIVGCLLLDELDTVATDLHKKDYEEIDNASPFARAHWGSYEEMQKFIAIREANNKANPNGLCLWSKATYEERGYTFNHELIA